MKGSFLSINFHRNTVIRFKGFCKKTGATYTDTLENMMDFFDNYQISPLENFGPTVRGMEANINKRINSMIAIVKNIEKYQTKPTTAMLELLFEHSPQKRIGPAPKAIGQQRVDPQRDAFIKKIEAAIVMERENTNLKIELKKNRADLVGILDRVHLVKSSFGRSKLELQMEPKDFETFKMKFKKG